jgi:vacuolar-type H+-ATPase subunit F/Vma7
MAKPDTSTGTMQKVVVLTDSESATGFRLAGSEVVDTTPEGAVAEPWTSR